MLMKTGPCKWKVLMELYIYNGIKIMEMKGVGIIRLKGVWKHHTKWMWKCEYKWIEWK